MRWKTSGSVDVSAINFRKVLYFRQIAIGSSFLQIFGNQRFQRSNGTFSKRSMRLAVHIVYVNTNILTTISKISKKVPPSIALQIFRKIKVVTSFRTSVRSGSFSVLVPHRLYSYKARKCVLRYQEELCVRSPRGKFVNLC